MKIRLYIILLYALFSLHHQYSYAAISPTCSASQLDPDQLAASFDRLISFMSQLEANINYIIGAKEPGETAYLIPYNRGTKIKNKMSNIIDIFVSTEKLISPWEFIMELASLKKDMRKSSNFLRNENTQTTAKKELNGIIIDSIKDILKPMINELKTSLYTLDSIPEDDIPEALRAEVEIRIINNEPE